MTVNHSFQTLFAVPMTCDGCVKDVSDALYALRGILKVDASLADQLITVEGTAAPSAIVEAIQATGRDAILRGSGASNSAAVSILETFHQEEQEAKSNHTRGHDHEDHDHDHGHDNELSNRHVRGLARMVEVSPTVTLIDLTLRGVAPGTYRATIREYGNLEDGVQSTGPVWSGAATAAAVGLASTDGARRGFMGIVEVGKDGRGSAFLDRPFQVWEVIGHAMVLTRQQEDEVGNEGLKNDANTVVGIIARSAGVWDNDKTVCSCTGKTLWEERKDEVEKGML